MRQSPGRIDLRNETDAKRYICNKTYTCIQSCCSLILTTPEWVREINSYDWICFDEYDSISICSARDFDSIFTSQQGGDTNQSPYFTRKHQVLTHKQHQQFFAYADTMRTVGKNGDYLVQDTVHPFHQSVCTVEEFDKNFSDKEAAGIINCQFSDTVDIPHTAAVEHSSIWGPSIRNHCTRMDSSNLELSACDEGYVCGAERYTLSLTKDNSIVCRQHSSSLLAFKLHRPTTIWKRFSGQGGRCSGGDGDMIVFHSSGDIEGIFPREEFTRHFRCSEVDVGIADLRTSDLSDADAYTICTEVLSLGSRQPLSRIYDVRAAKINRPFVAYTDTGIAQFGNSGDYLVQVAIPTHGKLWIWSQEDDGDSMAEDRSNRVDDESSSSAGVLDVIDITTEDLANKENSSCDGSGAPLASEQTTVDCQWIVGAAVFEAQYFQVDTCRDNRQNSKISDLTVADQLDMFRVQHKDVPGIYAQPFEVYSSTVLCWKGTLKKRTKLLRQWQSRQCEIYPDKIVISEDQDGSRSIGDIDGSRIGTTDTLSLRSLTDSGAYICLRHCSVHQTVIDDHPVIYLGNARMNDDDAKPLSLEPFHITSDFKRWESRYSKLFSVVSTPASTLLTSSKSLGDVTASKTGGHMSYSNKNGIFLMALSAAAHNAVVALLESCVLYCRREMAFRAAITGDCAKALEVLSSVSPSDAFRIVSSPNDPRCGRLLQHEAARTSRELLQEIFNLFHYHDDVRENHSIVSLGSSDDDVHPRLPLPLTVNVSSTCGSGLNCLHHAVDAGQWDVMYYLLEGNFFGIGVNSTTLSGETPLHFANTSRIVTYLIEKGANPVALDFEGNTPLMLMAGRGSFAAITNVIRKSPADSVDINTQSWKTGLTALMMAINRLSKTSQDYSDVLILVELLLHHGADPEICDIQKNTCLHCVCSIFRAACSDNSSDPKRRQITHHAIDACSKIMKILVDYGTSKKAINAKGHIPFTIIAQSKNYSVSEAVVTAVLNTVIFAKKTVNKDDASTQSEEDYQLDCTEILNFRTETGASCLHLAVEAINPEILEYLLRKGVDPNCKDLKGFTPLDVLKSKQLRAGGGMVERQATDLLKCLKILYDHGAVRRLRADLPVEQDSDSVVFSRLSCGQYQVKSATVEAMVKRLCNDQLYCDDDARALVLGYTVACTDVDLLRMIIDEFLSQIDHVRKSLVLPGVDDSAAGLAQLGPPLLSEATGASMQIVFDEQERGRTISEDDLPGSVHAENEKRPSEVKDPNEWDALHQTAPPLEVSEVLRPAGILSLVMMWFNMTENRGDELGEEVFILAKQLAHLILRNCPEELSRESIALLNMGLSSRGLNEHIRRGLACMYKSRVAKQSSFNIGNCDVQRNLEACQLDDILETSGLAPAYKKEFVTVLVGQGDSLTSIRPIEFAQQVTLMQHHMFSKITVGELLSMKYRCDTVCPNLKVMRDWNNDVTNFLLNEILFASNVTSRADFIAFLISSAFISIEVMNNFDFPVIVLGVLECTAIYRLKATWEKVEILIPGKRSEFKKLVGIAGRNVGGIMSKCVPPMVPYLGCYLQKLINLNEVPSRHSNGHINITKFRGIAHILYSHQEAQKVNYKIQIDVVFQTLLIAPVEWTSEEEFIARSRELEPPVA